MLGIFSAIGEVFGFAKTLTSSKQRRERYELLLDKKVKKALDSAESIIFGIDSYLNKSITLKQFKYIMKKHRGKFFDNN